MSKPQVADKLEEMIKGLRTMPKFRVTPLRQTKDEKLKAALMTKFLEESWPYVEKDVESRMRQMVNRCFLLGQHRWIGMGERNRHVCRNCGFRAPTHYDPKFTGAIEVYWDEKKMSENS